MKRFTLLVLLLILSAASASASVRLEWDDATGTGTDNFIAAIAYPFEGETGGEAVSLALGELETKDQTPTLTFTITSDTDMAVQTTSLTVSLVASHHSALTLETVTFDASGSHPAESVVALYEWDLDGDGIFDTSTESETLRHAYADSGIVLVQVRVTDELGRMALSEALELEIVNQPPRAQFDVNLGDAAESSLIQFENLSQDEDGTIASWLYDFGDGATSAEADPSHSYDAAGVFQVTLTVTDDEGARSDIFALEIEISNLGPQARFTSQQSTLSENQSLLVMDQSIDPSADGEIVHVAWDFGDGTYLVGGPSLDGVYSHVFSAPGTYTITLYVIDNAGAMALTRTTINVP